MGLTGVIYGGIVACWLCYLVPLALRRHDEAARTRSIDRFSAAMRVLGRDGDSARLVGHRTLSASTAGTQVAVRRRPSPAAARRAARVAARRRRRTLSLLVLAGLVVASLAAGGLVPWWSVAVPGGSVACWLVLARWQLSRTRTSEWEDALRSAAVAPAVPVEPCGDEPDESPTVEMAAIGSVPREQLVEQCVVAAPVSTADGRSLWDPLPVTLPTYVTKPRAERSVRTVDLTGDGVWSSGRLPADEALVDAPPGGPGEPETVGETPRRAVGD